MSSSEFRLNQMIKVFERCLDEAEVFKRDVPNRSLFDWVEKEEKDRSRWAVLVAGVSDETAGSYFKPGSSSIENATVPLHISGGGRAEILLQMRPSNGRTCLPSRQGSSPITRQAKRFHSSRS